MNTDENEHDQVGAYVLDALSDEERLAFERHLAGCEACRAEVADLQRVVDVLPLACDAVEPSPALRDRLMAAIEAEQDERAPLVAIPGGRTAPRGRMRWRLPEIVGIAAAAILVIGLGLWNVHLQQQINQDRSALAYQQQVAQAIATGAAVSSIPATNKSPGASAAVVQPRNRRPAYLIVQGLKPAAARHVYEVWFIRGHAKPVPVTVFSPAGSEPQVVPLPMSASGYTLAAVTVEPGRVQAPTGPMVLAGPLTA